MEEIYLRFIEAKLIRDGELNSKDFIETFGVKRQTGSRMFGLYRKECPTNMFYEPVGCGSKYKRGDAFEAQYLEGCADEFLSCLGVVFRAKASRSSLVV